MKVAMMQPSFIPWQGFFELIYKSDIFVFLDDFQFSVQSYHQRNRLFVNKEQTDWFTVPILKSVSFHAPLNATRLNESTPWRVKMRKRIMNNYSRTPFYKEISPVLEAWLGTQAGSLAEQNMNLILSVCKHLGFKPEFRKSSDYATVTTRSARVMDILKWCNAKTYYCAKGSFEYMKEDGLFPNRDVEVLFQNFIPKPYDQSKLSRTFVPFLSVVDALMHVGPVDTAELIRSGTEKWISWQEMSSL